MIACNTQALQEWWDAKNHHATKNSSHIFFGWFS